VADSEKSGRKRKTAERIDMPDALNVPDFLGCWERWLRYRRARNLTTTPDTLNAQLRKCVGFGVEKAIRSIDASIEAGWQGLFEPRGNHAKRTERDAAGTRPGEFPEKPGLLEQYAQRSRPSGPTPPADRAAG
jgi:hypothetical protein